MNIYEAATKSFNNFAKTRAEKKRGLKEAATVVLAAVAFVTGIEADNLSLWKVVAVWGLVYCAYRSGSILDTLVFDRLYGAKCKRATDEELAMEPRPMAARLCQAWHAVIDLLPGAKMLMYASRNAAAEKLGAVNA